MKLSELKAKRVTRCEIPEHGLDWNCPECDAKDFTVEYTRKKKKGIYRKRTCICGLTLETFEKITKTHKQKPSGQPRQK
jgi:hypothetical protein